MCSYKILNEGTTTKCSRIPWQTSVMCFYFILALMNIAPCEAIPRIKEFFPSIKNDLTKVTWAHNVYNDDSFQQALREKVMMIVGDVTKQSRGPKNWLPIMATKNARKYGITLQQFLKKVADAKSVGVKLNFDSMVVFNNSITVLQAMSGEMKFPLWLNAVTDNMREKDIDKFLSLCTHNFPEATISIGMLRKWQTLESGNGYTAKLVTQMKDILTRNNVTQTVAFPVKTSKVGYSLDTLPALKDVHGITDSALYMYGDVFLTINTTSNLKKFIKDFGKDRVYMDCSEYIFKKLI